MTRPLGPRQRAFLATLLRRGGTSSAAWSPKRQSVSLARRGLVVRNETGSTRLTAHGRRVAESIQA